MAKVLLVDTNFSSAPIHRALRAAGHEVHVIGGNPQDALAKSAPHYIRFDYSDAEGLAALVREQGFEHIVPGCNDRSYAVCATLAAQGLGHGIDTPEVTDILNNKARFRSFAMQTGLPVPQAYALDALPLDRPLIVKPADAFSGRGVTIVETPDAARLEMAIASARDASRSGTCVVEDYVTGQLYSHSCFIADGCVIAEFVVEEHGTANPFVVDTSRLARDFPPAMLARVREAIETMAQALDLHDGLIHTQFIAQGDAFWLIEITRRCPGDLYSQLIELSTGFPYVDGYTRPFTGRSYADRPASGAQRWIMRHTLSQRAAGTLDHLHFNCALQIERLIPLLTTGDTIRESPYGRLALLFAEAQSQAELDALFERTLQRALYAIEP